MNISNGDRVKDNISGFTGTVTARVEYITKCIQYLVTPDWVKGQSFSEGSWIDEIRLEIVSQKSNVSPLKQKPVRKRRSSTGTHGHGFGPEAPKRAGGQVGTRE